MGNVVTAAQPAAQLTLLGDQPSAEGDDSLGFAAIADDLARLILESRQRTPLTLGIEGNWGAGKSSLMQRVERRLNERPEVVTVWFNAWTADRGDVLEGLIKSVLDRIDPNILRRAVRNERVKLGLRLTATMLAGWLRVGSVVDKLWERASVDPKARNEMRDLLARAMEDWVKQSPTGAGDRLLVVFIDDLDRCSPDAVFQVFEAIKLYLDARGFAFVVGFDNSVVSEAVLEHKKYSKTITSRVYLEKIVQIEYRIPEPTDDQMIGLTDAYAAASGVDRYIGPSERSLIVDGNERNPRRLKRFINSFILEHHLDPDVTALPPATRIRTLILKVYFYEFARLFGDRSDPIREFLDYLEVRRLIRDDDRNERVLAFLAEHDLAANATLAELEENVPEGFSELARNDDFVDLVRALHAGPTREDAVSSLQKTVDPITSAPPVVPTASMPEPAAAESAERLRGLRILWLDDNPRGNYALAERFEREGATVVHAQDRGRAGKVLRGGGQFDVLISDVTRGDDKEAGYVDLEWLRSEGLFEGRPIFYVNRITPARRKRAESLGALVTNTPQDLLQELIGAAATVRRPLEK